jgi:hypothetical protein
MTSQSYLSLSEVCPGIFYCPITSWLWYCLAEYSLFSLVAQKLFLAQPKACYIPLFTACAGELRSPSTESRASHFFEVIAEKTEKYCAHAAVWGEKICLKSFMSLISATEGCKANFGPCMHLRVPIWSRITKQGSTLLSSIWQQCWTLLNQGGRQIGLETQNKD